MGPKLLFVLGIVVAHGALGAAWLHQDAPTQRLPIASCVQTPAPQPYFESRAELLARVMPVATADLMVP